MLFFFLFTNNQFPKLINLLIIIFYYLNYAFFYSFIHLLSRLILLFYKILFIRLN